MSIAGGFARLRLLSTSARAAASSAHAGLPQHGDPGPQAMRFRKSQRKAMREGRGTKAIDGLDYLDRVFDSSSTPKSVNSRAARPADRARRNTTRDARTQPTADPYGTSLRLKKIIRPIAGSMTTADIDKAIKLVMDSPRSAVSIPVWNMLLSMIGREGRLELMWKTFNDMKKRGFKPNSRTYTTLLNAYAGLRHSADTLDRHAPRVVEPKTMSRVTVIYDQANIYLSEEEAALRTKAADADPAELGLATDAVIDSEVETSTADHDVNLGPTNAYLKFLARHGLLNEMDKILTAMPNQGPLSPDTITYTTTFSALFGSISRVTGSELARTISKASSVWARMCRQFAHTQGAADPQRVMDESVILIVLKCLARGDPPTRRMMMEVVDSIWALPRPSSTLPATPLSLPRLPLTVRAATSIMSICPNPTDRSHYAQLFLHRPELSAHIDTPFLIAAIRALSETGDIATVRDIFNNYQPRQPNQWPMCVWHDALTAARWKPREEQGPDFQSAVEIITQMTSPVPHQQTHDIRGTKWAKPQPVDPDAKALALLLKIALGKGWREVERALELCTALKPKIKKEQDKRSRGGTRDWDVEVEKEIDRARERIDERR